MVSASRPEWTGNTNGIPIDCVVRLHGGTPGIRQDIQTSRNRVSLVRPGSLQPKPEDEYDLSFVYGPESTNADVHDRTVVPLLRKFIEGYNVTILMFGATGSGKTTSLEGGRGKDAKGSSEGDGLVHLAIDELYDLIHGKAVTIGGFLALELCVDLYNQACRHASAVGWQCMNCCVVVAYLTFQRCWVIGEAVAKKRRMPSSKGFDYFIESSFVEMYNEACHDLYAKASEQGSNLPVVEDVNEGYVVTGINTRASKNATELKAAFNYGRSNRDMQMMDLGSVHERTAAIFNIWLAQYAPAAVHGEEDRMIVSRFQFVDMPGAERLGMDPEVLRLREGVQLNKSLLSFAHTTRTLAQDGSTEFVNYDDSVLTKLLSDALGSNCLTAVIGTVRQGEWEHSTTTLKHLSVARNARNFPIINHSRARGLLHKLRFRLLSIMVSDVHGVHAYLFKGKNSSARGGARTHDHKVKSLALYRLSYPGMTVMPGMFDNVPMNGSRAQSSRLS
eukprot:jgi/Chrzof1/8793/Cz03g24220.t1